MSKFIQATQVNIQSDRYLEKWKKDTSKKNWMYGSTITYMISYITCTKIGSDPTYAIAYVTDAMSSASICFRNLEAHRRDRNKTDQRYAVFQSIFKASTIP